MSAPTSSRPCATSRTAHSSSAEVRPPGSGVPVPGDEGRVEHVDVHGQVGGAGAHRAQGARDDLPDPEVANLVHEQARDAALCLPGEFVLPGPVAAQADLRVARRVDLAVVHQGAHEGSVGELHAEHLFAGVGVSVEVHDADRAVRGHACAHARLGDRVVAAQQHGRRAGGEHLPHHALDRRVRATRVAGQHGRVAEVHDPELREGIHARPPGAGPGGLLAARIARGAKLVPGRSETRSSIGAPTIATSTPSSSAASSVYGQPAKVSSPA